MKIATMYVGCKVSAENAADGKEKSYTNEHVQATIADVLVGLGIDGYTLTEGVGLWEGAQERTVVVTLAVMASPLANVEGLKKASRSIALRLRQDCVMLTIHNADVFLINA